MEDTSPLDLGAVTEVFGIDRGLVPDWYEVSFCGPRRGRFATRGGLSLSVEKGLEGIRSADTVIVLPEERLLSEPPKPAIIDALVAAASRGTRVVSVCLGAFALAAAGLLDNRRATTHWMFCDLLGRQYPLIEVIPDVLYVDEGSILTAGGVAAGIDLCLHIVRSDHGAEVANRLARRMVFGPHREGGQAQFIQRAVALDGDDDLDPALSWAIDNLDRDLSIDDMASVASMSRRTFYREFHARTGTTPYRWLVAQRILLARRLLETTQLSVEVIALRSGFRDASAMRSYFVNQVGLAPTRYRSTFGEDPNTQNRSYVVPDISDERPASKGRRSASAPPTDGLTDISTSRP